MMVASGSAQPSCHQAHQGLVDSKLISEFSLRDATKGVTGDDRLGISIGQFGRRVFFPVVARHDCSTFRLPVQHVVVISARKPMRWVLARWIVTTMKNVVSFWNRANEVGVCPSVSAYLGAIDGKLPIGRFSVLIDESSRGPFPTFIRALDINFDPVALFNRQHGMTLRGLAS